METNSIMKFGKKYLFVSIKFYNIQQLLSWSSQVGQELKILPILNSDDRMDDLKYIYIYIYKPFYISRI